MSSTKIFSVFFLAIVGVVLGGLLYLGYFMTAIITPSSTDGTVVPFVIRKGDGVNQISQNLSDAGLIQSMWNFEVYVWMKRLGASLQAGEYEIPKNVTIRELTSILAAGKDATPELNITIIEGWTIADIAAYLEDEGVVTAQQFTDAATRMQSQQLIPTLADKPESASLEGYLFPDTYRIYRGASSEEIILKMLANFQSKMQDDILRDIERRGLTVYEVVTMASIVEKEVRHPEDLPIVADLFWRRLAAGQRLESDATLNYVLETKTHRLSAVELENPSLYNSYRHDGLPPGPISNPGFRALLATVRPKANSYWYFLTGDDGVTRYAETFREHVDNKQKYLQ